MADQLATPEDLAALLERDDLDLYKATMLVEVATAIVQEAAGNQRIVQVANDPLTTMGTTDSWLSIPQIPVTAVASVTLDGTALTAGIEHNHYKRSGNRLWRTDGWQTYCDQPSEVVTVVTHGYPPGSQGLQLGRGAVLGLIKGVYGNPTGATRLAIDDYSAAYEAIQAQMDASEFLQRALRNKYGRKGGLVRIG